MFFSLPVLIFIFFVILSDPFKIFFNYEDYYTGDQIINLNREYVCTKVFEKNRDKFNSFIFGNSRSLAFKCSEWETYLRPNSKAFHWDAHGESILGILNKLKYIKNNGIYINNCLFIVDYDLLTKTKLRSGPLFISPPDLSDNTYFSFYSSWFKYVFSPNFLFGYMDYNIFKKRREYMKGMFLFSKFKNEFNPFNMEMTFGYEKEIREDSMRYYNNFVKNDPTFELYTRQYNINSITDEEIIILQAIRDIVNIDNSNYKIIISPLFDKIKLDKERINLLREIFDPHNVYDFSGSNEITMDTTNYYESSHYRHKVASKILKIIYAK